MENSRKMDNEEDKVKKKKLFCAKEFRRSLHGTEDALKVVRNFGNLAQNTQDQDVISEYLEAGGSVQELLSLLDVSAMSDLTTAMPVFKAVYMVAMRFNKMSDDVQVQTKEGIKYLLHSFGQTIQSMLNLKSSKHRKVVLKLLTCAVTVDHSLAKDILTLLSFPSDLLEELAEPAAGKQSLRSSFIHFVLSLLFECSVPLIRIIIQKGFLNYIFQSLKYDEADNINLVLGVINKKLLHKTIIQKSIKLKIFNTQILKHILDVYYWVGPRSASQLNPVTKQGKRVQLPEASPEERESVYTAVTEFLTVVCASKKYGIAFYDVNFGISATKHNQVLFTLLQAIKNPWQKETLAQLVINILISCPDLIYTTLLRLEESFKPRDSEMWFQAIQFVEKLFSALEPSMILTAVTSFTVTQLSQVLRSLCSPTPVIRSVAAGLLGDASWQIRVRCAELINIMWTKMQMFLRHILSLGHLPKAQFALLTNMIHQSYIKALPDAKLLLLQWRQAVYSEDPNTRKVIPALVEVIVVLFECQGELDSTESVNTLITSLLDSLSGGVHGLSDEDLARTRLALVQMIDVPVLSIHEDLFETALVILVTNGLSDDTLPLTVKLLLSSGVFESNEDEVYVWLYTFEKCRHRKKRMVSFLVESLRQACHDPLITEDEDCDNEEEVSNFANFEHILQGLKEVDLDESEQNINKSVQRSSHSLTPLLTAAALIARSQNCPKIQGTALEYLNLTISYLFYLYPTNNEKLIKFCKQNQDFLNEVNCEYSLEPKKPKLPTYSTETEAWIFNYIPSKPTHKNDPQIEENVSKCTRMEIFNSINYLIYFFTVCLKNNLPLQKHSDRFLCYFNILFNEIKKRSNLIGEQNTKHNIFTKCLNLVFTNNIILKHFLSKQNEVLVCQIVEALLVFVNHLEMSDQKNVSLDLWRKKLLRKVTTALQKGDAMEQNYACNLIDKFEFSEGEVINLLNVFKEVHDVDTFFYNKKLVLSKKMEIFAKFLYMYLEKKQNDGLEIILPLIKVLSSILTHADDKGCGLDVPDACMYQILLHSNVQDKLIQKLINMTLSRRNVNHNTILCAQILYKRHKEVYMSSVKKKITDIQPEFVTSIILKNQNRINEPLKMMLSSFYKKHKQDIQTAIVDVTKGKVWVMEDKQAVQLLITTFMGKEDGRTLVPTAKLNSALLCKVIEKLNNSEDASLLYDWMEQVLKHLILHVKTGSEKQADKTDMDIDDYESKNGNAERNYKKKLKSFEEKGTEAESENYNFEEDCALVQLLTQNKHCNWTTLATSVNWNSFVKLIFKNRLTKSREPLLKLTRLLLQVIYQGKQHLKQIHVYFQLFVSHSDFFPLLMRPSSLKDELLELLLCFVKLDASLMAATHVPVLLSAYNARLSHADMLILEILELYERNGIQTSQYEPYIWGDSAAIHYSVRSAAESKLSLWQQVNMLQVLNCIDQDVVAATISKFPIHRGFKPYKQEANGDVYDPAFFLPLYASLLGPGAIVYCYQFIYKGALGLTISALSCKSADLRAAAGLVLCRFYDHLQLQAHMKQKAVWLHFIDCVRFGIEDLSTKPLPPVVSTFYSRMSLELSQPLSKLYSPLSDYLLAKPFFDLTVLPEFTPLFQSSDVNYANHRLWILEVIRDGVNEDTDVAIIMKRKCLKIILSFYESYLSDVNEKVVIIEILTNLLKTSKPFKFLTNYGLVEWILHISKKLDENTQDILLDRFLNLLQTLTKLIGKSAWGVYLNLMTAFRSSSQKNMFEKYLTNLSKLLPIVKLDDKDNFIENFINIVSEVQNDNNDVKTWLKIARDIRPKSGINQLVCEILSQVINQ